uniref:Uncharacterized protein n=1 Tax=Strombidium inclinatum TaxID=197538 RepID=A0A7S3MYQ0_9SPIT|eukprot:CAMPEP_0170487042 /NCGR_PEP_ID=MMETSP0208-20121228/5910_1 /TAXON_ID=197538 /ORGANISM="Strombidium inclinatum, Strain S3" /LENGTH=131 /DNA_ID=CAMNT_0010761163 /DNA_START=219 /DNA_END=614 /DNA_ORIENTATION=-
MIVVFLELADVAISAGELLGTLAVHHTADELTFVLSHIRPDHDSLSIDRILEELPLVNLAGLSEVVFALALELAIDKLTLVVAASIFEASKAGFLAFDEVALILDDSSVPPLDSFAVLAIVLPLAFINGAG